MLGYDAYAEQREWLRAIFDQEPQFEQHWRPTKRRAEYSTTILPPALALLLAPQPIYGCAQLKSHVRTLTSAKKGSSHNVSDKNQAGTLQLQPCLIVA